MVTFYSHDLIWDEEDNGLISFEYIHLVSPGEPITVSHMKIKHIAKSKCEMFPYDSRCDYFFFGVLFRLMVIIYPTIWTIHFEVGDSDDKDEFIRGFNFIKRYREEGLSQRWGRGSSQEELMDYLKLKYIVLNHV